MHQHSLFLPSLSVMLSKYQTDLYFQSQPSLISPSLLSCLCLSAWNPSTNMLHQAGSVHNSFVFPMFSDELLCKVQSSLIPLGEKSQLSRRGLSSWLFNLSNPLQTLHPDNRLDTWFNTTNLSKSEENKPIIQPLSIFLYFREYILYIKCTEHTSYVL